MAEAVVEERAPMPTRYYCHMCNVEINIPNSDFTCPLCAGGFVEELPPNATLSPSTSSSNASTASEGASSSSRARRVSGLDALRSEIATLLMSRNGPNVEISFDPGSRGRANVVTIGGARNLSGRGQGNGSGNGNGSGTGGGRVRPQNLDRLDNVLLEFLQSISGGDVTAAFGNSQMFFMGNPGDYAWGREGIDTIVTQLLNQMETSGPPPLAKDKIAEIPKAEVTAEEVERKLQCSVCWEDFRLAESVLKLPCSHLYHENCIVPWLDLHGTCPICRKSLNDEDVQTSNSGNNIDGGGPPISNIEYPLQRNTLNSGGSSGGAARSSNQSGNNATSRDTTTNTAPSQSQNQRNNVFGFDDGNVDLD